MPYIKSDDGRRQILQRGAPALNAGELNYQIFYYVKHINEENYNGENRVKKYVDQFLTLKPNYQRYNDMTGALIRCYLEIKRRLNLDYDYLIELCASYDDEINKYEDLKCIENGDVE